MSVEAEQAEAYRPCNGSEGRWFMSEHCDMCSHDHAAHMGNHEDGCRIVARALAFDIGDERYPTEWVYTDGGGATCTAFKPDGCS